MNRKLNLDSAWILDEDGEFVINRYPLVKYDNCQVLGNLVTPGRRYRLSSLRPSSLSGLTTYERVILDNVPLISYDKIHPSMFDEYGKMLDTYLSRLVEYVVVLHAFKRYELLLLTPSDWDVDKQFMNKKCKDILVTPIGEPRGDKK